MPHRSPVLPDSGFAYPHIVPLLPDLPQAALHRPEALRLPPHCCNGYNDCHPHPSVSHTDTEYPEPVSPPSGNPSV